LKTYHIYIKGIIQGVGFRPFIYKLAQKMELLGWVNNTTNGVHIQFNSDKDIADKFIERIKNEAPKISVITSLSIEEVPFERYSSFEIIHSSSEEDATLLLTPDFAMCEDCRKELNSNNNNRFNFPFITCITLIYGKTNMGINKWTVFPPLSIIIQYHGKLRCLFTEI